MGNETGAAAVERVYGVTGLEILHQRPDIVAGLRRMGFDRWRNVAP